MLATTPQTSKFPSFRLRRNLFMSLTSTVPTLLSDAALAYAWCKVCFTAWDETLDAAGERILSYSRYRAHFGARFLHAIYPAYFVYASMKKLNGSKRA